jgi:hypothetical protein
LDLGGNDSGLEHGAFIDGTVVNVVLPTLQTTFHASVVEVQWVVEA